MKAQLPKKGDTIRNLEDNSIYEWDGARWIPQGRPILYIDVDGVLFGQYGVYKGPQLRPDVLRFMDWCTHNFVCRWLTSYPEDRLKQLFWCLYGPHIVEDVEYINWHAYGEKDDAVKALGGDYYWIEDDPIDMHPYVQGKVDEKGRSRYIEVSPYGSYSLTAAMSELEIRIKDRGMQVINGVFTRIQRATR